MFLRYLLLVLIATAGFLYPRDAIAEKPEDVFGFSWKMSYAEANKIASGKLVKDREASHFGKTGYDIENPKEPSGAENINLSFFNGELYSVNVSFWLKNAREFKEKSTGIVKFLKSKHSNAEATDSSKKNVVAWLFNYRNEAGDVTENPYNLEQIAILGIAGSGPIDNLLSINYSFYGASDIYQHIKKLKEEKEFGDF